MSKLVLRAVHGRSSLAIFLLIFVIPLVSGQSLPASVAIQANHNRAPAGKLEKGVLTLHLEVRQGAWYPEADTGPSMKVYAFVSLPTVGEVQGNWKHGRPRKLLLARSRNSRCDDLGFFTFRHLALPRYRVTASSEKR